MLIYFETSSGFRVWYCALEDGVYQTMMVLIEQQTIVIDM